jgi:ABC-type branched-subunit amino acid transport system ATPase component
MTSTNSGLVIDRLTKYFGGIHVFQDISLDVPPGRVTACIGPNGAGKTTLINIVSGVFPATSGRVLLDGAPMAGLAPYEIVRRGVSRTFQDVRIFPSLSVVENVLTGFPGQRGERLRNLFAPGRAVGADEREVRERAGALLDLVAMLDLADRPAGELPFGQQKLLALLRAVATGARILLLDEPATGVELEMLPRITGLIRRLVKEEGRGVLLVEHNVDVVREIADQVVVLQGGAIIAVGPCESVLQDERVIDEYLGRIYDA